MSWFHRLLPSVSRTELAKTNGKPRSPHWPAVRAKFLQGKACAVCGGTKDLEAHHIEPFHVNPKRELDPSNLLALCEADSARNCHLLVGHLGNFRGWNPGAKQDAPYVARLLARNRERAEGKDGG